MSPLTTRNARSHDCHLKLYKSIRVDYKFETKKLGFLMVYFVLLTLASHEEIRRQLIILCV